METALDLSRWRTAPKGVGYRRWTIISAALKQLTRTRLFRWIIALAWFSGALIALIGYVFSQTVASGGWLETIGGKINPRLEAVAAAFSGLVALYPDVCIGGMFTLVFWLHSFVALVISLLALGVMVPNLIARDQASNALTIYLSRPLTTFDYLLGKLGTIVGVLLLLWTGPLLFGWLLSMIFATDREFLLYSVGPLSRALLFNGIAMVAIALIALGVSAVTRSSRMTNVIWVVAWIVAWFIAAIPDSPKWLQRASFMHDLSEVRQNVLELDAAFNRAASSLPLMDPQFKQALARGGQKTQSEDFTGALWGLGVLTLVSSAVFFRRIRAE